MKIHRLILALLCSGALLGSGCHSSEPAASRQTAVPPIVRGVVTETVRLSPQAETVELSGTVRARTSAVVSVRVPGTVTLLRVREGDRVRRGELLARLDAREHQAAAAAAAAGLEEAQRGVDEALARQRLADATLERYQKLFSGQAISRQEFEVKQTEKEVAAQGVARAQARLRQTREGAQGASAMADYTRIAAPLSGIVTSRQAGLGASVFPGQPLFTIDDEGSYSLEVAVPESMVTRIKAGTAVRVILDALDARFAATITEIVPASDPGSRTFIARVAVKRPGLRSGMFGRCLLSTGEGSSVIRVPAGAVSQRGALSTVWVVDKGGLASLRLVKTGKTVGDRVEILSGVSDGERLATSGLDRLSEGTRVE